MQHDVMKQEEDVNAECVTGCIIAVSKSVCQCCHEPHNLRLTSYETSRSPKVNLMEGFACIDLMLLLAGCKLVTRTLPVRLLNRLMLVLFVASYQIGLLPELLTSSIGVRVGLIHKMLQVLCGYIFVYILNKNRRTIIQTVRLLVKDFNGEQRKALKRHSIASIILYAMALLAMIVLQYVAMMEKDSKDGRTRDKSHEALYYRIRHVSSLFWLLNFNSWFTAGIMLYTYFVKVIRFSEENYFKNLESKSPAQLHDHAAALALDRRRMEDLRKRLVGSLSLVPFFWFAQVFVETPTAVLEARLGTSSWLWIVSSMFEIVVQIIAVTFVAYQCDECTRLIQKKAGNLIDHMLTNDSFIYRTVFVNELEKSGQFSMFKSVALNRSFYLVFASALLSFTVFFVEKTEDVVKKELEVKGMTSNLTQI